MIDQARRKLLFGCSIAALLQACGPKQTLAFAMNKSPITEDEFRLLTDLQARQAKVGNGTLVISDRLIEGAPGDDQFRLNDSAFENVHFINCYFIGQQMFRVSMMNVVFERCGFRDTRWEGGKWSDLRFSACGFIGRSLSMAPSGGSGITLIEKCYFEGGTPEKAAYANFIDYFGNFGVGGKARYVDCELVRFDLHIDAEIEIQGGTFDRLAITSRSHGGSTALSISDCAVTNVFIMSNCVISKITFTNTEFPRVDANRVEASDVVLDKVQGNFDFMYLKATSLSISKATLEPRFPDNPAKSWSLSIVGADIRHIQLNDCKFEGANPRIIAWGVAPDRDKDGKIIPPIFKETGEAFSYSTEIGTLAVKGSALVNGDFSYVNIGDLTIEGSQVKNTNFAHSKIARLSLTNSTISGSLDFSDTQVTSTVVQNVDKRALKILRDKKTILDLAA